jgi:hypothetical protein
MPSYSRSPRRRSRSRSRGRFDDGGRRYNGGGRSRSRSRDRINDEDLCRLHVADLTTSVSQGELERAFSKFGELRESWMAKVIYFKKDLLKNKNRFCIMVLTCHRIRLALRLSCSRTKTMLKRH